MLSPLVPKTIAPPSIVSQWICARSRCPESPRPGAARCLAALNLGDTREVFRELSAAPCLEFECGSLEILWGSSQSARCGLTSHLFSGNGSCLRAKFLYGII